MAAFITGLSNYPSNFDINPTGTGTATRLSYVLDEIRDSSTGVIIQSGNKVVAIDVNAIYTSNDSIQRTLGINPQGLYSDVSARINFMEFSGSQAFIPFTGGNVSGQITFNSGIPLVIENLESSGLNWNITTGTTITSSGTFLINNNGLLQLVGTNVSITGSLLSADVNNVQLNSEFTSQISGNTSVKLIASDNTIIVGNTNTTINKSFLPASSGSVDIGSPSSYFSTLYVDNLINVSGESGAFVTKSGSNIYGDINFTESSSVVLGSGSSISNLISGINQIGSSSFPFGSIYTKTLYASFVSGLSPVLFQSDIIVGSGLSLFTEISGLSNLGTSSNPFGTLYVNSIVGATGLDASQFVLKSGSDMFGNMNLSGNASINLESGSNILVSDSGTNQLGASGTPIGDIWVDRVNNRSEANFVFNEPLTGTINGSNRIFTLANTPQSGYINIFASGIYVKPTVEYVIVGNEVTFTGSFRAPTVETERPYAGFYIY